MKRMKKLTAALLALAMLLSFSVTALATTEDIGGDNNSTGAGNSATFETIGGEVISEAVMESKRPQDVIRVVMPTVTREVSTMKGSTFDMILDPHNLIQESIASGTDKVRVANSDFAADTLVYFKTKEADATANTKAQYSADSKELTIINKSNVPVSIGLQSIVTRDASEDSYALGEETFKLVSSLTADGTTPEMVLALVSGDNSDNITTPSEIGVPTFDTEGATLVKEISFAFAADLEDNYKKAVNDAIEGKKLTFTPTKESGTKSASALDKVVATFNATDLELDGATSVDAETWADNAATPITTGTLDLTLSVKSKASLVDPDDNQSTLTAKVVGTVTVKLDAEAVQAQLAETTPAAEDITASAWTLADSEVASIETALDTLEGAYTTQYDNNVYSYVLDNTLTDDDFESVSFHLNAKINGGDVWDDLFSNNLDTLIDIDVIWDVFPFTGDEDDLPAKGPSASVKTKAAAVNDEVEIAYNLGRGDKASEGIDKVTYVNGTKTVTIAPVSNENGIYTIKAVSALFTAGTVKVTFKAAQGQEAVTVDLAIK